MIGILYYIKLECVGCGSDHLVPVYNDGPHWKRVCDVCDSMGTGLGPAEFTVQEMVNK